MPVSTTSWTKLSNKIRRNLGSGMIDVELTQDQIDDAIIEALEEFRSNASPATKEGWMFLKLVPGQRIYRMPGYVMDVYDIERGDFTMFSGISGNQFSSYIMNYMLTGEPFDLLSFHLARSFLETLNTLSAAKINFRLHSSLVALGSDEINEVPDTRPTGSTNIDNTVSITTPPGELDMDNKLRLTGPVLEILSQPTNEEYVLLNIQYTRSDAELITDVETGPWIHKYARACAKVTLGMAYRKFANLPGPGGGLSLPGSDLITEGEQEKKDLIEDLFNLKNGEEAYALIMG